MPGKIDVNLEEIMTTQQDLYVNFNSKLFIRRQQLKDQFIGEATLNIQGSEKTTNINSDAFEILELLDRDYTIGKCTEILANKYGMDKKILSEVTVGIVKEFIENNMAELSETAIKKEPVVPACLDNNFLIKAVNIELLSKCNLKCRHCYGEFGPESSAELSTDTVISILDQLKILQCRNIIFTGGEVLLRDDFLDILEYGDQHNFGLSFLTNGILVTPGMAERLSKIEGLAIQVSIDGSTAELHDALRGKGSFRRAMQGLELLKYTGCELYIAAVLNKINYKTIEEMSELAKRVNAQLNIAIMLKSGQATRNLDELYIEPSLYYDICKNGNSDHLPSSIPAHESNDTPSDGYINRCNAGKKRFSIRANGDIVTCHFFPQIDKFLMGNIYQSDIADILHNYNREERLGDLNALNIKGCKNCLHVEKCKGGCVAIAYAEYGDINHPDPFSCARHRALSSGDGAKALIKTGAR
jgi:radical SAM protein with 4Fe4S-binding SPASM domain